MNFLIPDKEPKMTESEIMKALEICSQNDTNKHYMMTYHGMPLHILFEATLALIKRKNAENERLEKEYDRVFKENVINKTEVERLKKLLDAECDTCACGLLEQRDKARAEAIKEFAERVKALMMEIEFLEDWDIDQIAKEMGVEL